MDCLRESGDEPGGSPLVDAQPHRQVVAQMPGEQEVFAHELVAGAAHPLSLVGVAQQVANAVRGAGR